MRSAPYRREDHVLELGRAFVWDTGEVWMAVATKDGLMTVLEIDGPKHRLLDIRVGFQHPMCTRIA